MIDPTEPLRAALADFGVDAVINYGPTTLRVVLDPEVNAAYTVEGLDRITRTGPSAVALQADVDAAWLQAGNQGDELTIGADVYTLLAIDPDGQGGAVLSLQRVV